MRGPNRDAVGFQLVGFTGPGRYPLTPDPQSSIGIYNLYDPDGVGAGGQFSSSPSNPGEVIVTELDTVAHRIAGRFSFEAKEDLGSRIVQIERGLFRVEYTVEQAVQQ